MLCLFYYVIIYQDCQIKHTEMKINTNKSCSDFKCWLYITSNRVKTNPFSFSNHEKHFWPWVKQIAIHHLPGHSNPKQYIFIYYKMQNIKGQYTENSWAVKSCLQVLLWWQLLISLFLVVLLLSSETIIQAP